MENSQKIRSHLTKEQRLPRCFKEVEKVLRSVKSCQQNYKTILANSRLRGHVHKKVYSMTVNVLKYYSYIQKIIDEIHLLEKEKYLRREIASILVYELIFGNGYLPGESKVVKTVQLYENDIFHAHEVLQNKVEGNLIVEINIPRYVRVHTLVTTVPYVIKDLTSYGFHQVIYENDLPEEKYLELVKNLNKGCFLIDYHFKDVLVFEHHENLTSLDLYKNGHIFLQDKSSYIPVHVLNPQPGGAVLDACAAPGMKTVHIAAKMKNKGILIACERDKSRFECLKKMLDCGSVKICKTLCKDFKLMDPSDQAYSTIECILIDPSCSGSGMVNRMDEVTDTEDSKNTERLSKLAGFQIILLKHALKFPVVQRVVYSTCSIHEEENEYVVHEALKAFSGTFKLVPAMSEWSHRGSDKFEFGKLCLRTDPKIHLTNGFFVAVFERINFDESIEECHRNYEDQDFSLKKRKKKALKQEKSYGETTEDCANVNFKEELNISRSLESHQMNDSVRNSNQNLESSVQNMNYEQQQNEVCAHQTKKHKKKKKEKSNEYFYDSNLPNFEISNEQALTCSESKECSSILISENNDYLNSQKRKGKSKHNKHQSERNSIQNIEVVEEFTDITKLNKKKKKKKKKECIETETINSDELNQEQVKHKIPKLKQHKNSEFELEDNNDVVFTSENVSTQDKYSMDIREDSEKFAIMTSSCKKKKKKEKDHFEEAQIINPDVPDEEQADMFSKRKHKISKLKHHNKDSRPESKLEDNTGAIFASKDVSFQNNYNMNICKDSEKLTNSTSSCKKKKKKKKEHSDVDDIQSHEKLKNKIFSPSAINDSINTHLSLTNKSESKDNLEVVDSTFLHKKEKKMKKDEKVSEEKRVKLVKTFRLSEKVKD